LAGWLLAPAKPDEVVSRHEAVDELRPKIDLREDLALLGDEVSAAISPEQLACWGASGTEPAPMAVRVTAFVLGLAALATWFGWFSVGTGPWPVVALTAVNMAFGWRLRRRVEKALETIGKRSRELNLLAELLARVEREPFQAPRLRRPRAELD